jgi:sugar/nucleoside kinase (ribokinase family)
MSLAVVGHVEWGEFARVERVPAPGEIVEALDACSSTSTARAGGRSRRWARADGLLMSADDAAERYRQGEIEPAPLAVVRTDGEAGGSVETADGVTSRWAASPLPGPAVDTYGAGDSFAGGLTFGLGRGRSLEQSLALGARCGAACVSGRGPYELSASENRG